jgi:hypothetical protein
MKYIFSFLLVFNFIFCFAQVGTVIPVETLTKVELFGNAQSFFAYYFKSANHVIQMTDPVSGRIVGKGIVDDRNVTITIDVKDAKYKYDVLITQKDVTEQKIVRILPDRPYGGMYRSDTYVKLIWTNGIL